MPARHYQPLPTIHLKTHVGYSHPAELPVLIHWEDPALPAMVDFKHIEADVISPDEPIDVALQATKACSYHVLLVVNKDYKVLGLISAEDLLGEKPLKTIQERRISRADISVQMVMTPQTEVVAVDIESLRHAKVGHIITTLHMRKQHYALVVEVGEHGKQMVRGLFSSALMSKQLGMDVISDLSEAQSIAELQHGAHHINH